MLDRKIVLLEEILHNEDRKQIKGMVNDYYKQHVSTLKEEIFQVLDLSSKNIKTDMESIEFKIKTFQDWFREIITPELAVMRAQISDEIKTREESDEDLLMVLHKY